MHHGQFPPFPDGNEGAKSVHSRAETVAGQQTGTGPCAEILAARADS